MTDCSGRKIGKWYKTGNDQYSSFCKLCLKNLGCKAGVAQLNQHVQSAEHKTVVTAQLHPLQLHLTGQSRVDETTKAKPLVGKNMFSERDAAYKAELIWALQTVQSSMSADSSDHIVTTFHAMFLGKIPDRMCLSAKKLTYLIIDALHSYFKQMLVKDI